NASRGACARRFSIGPMVSSASSTVHVVRLMRARGRHTAHMYRVVQWATGNVGRHTIPGIDAHPDLELVGVWVSSAAKDGKDAGELAGLGRMLGVAATTDAEALIALEPDCIVNTAMADHRLGEAIEDLIRFLRAGINVVASGPV